MTREELMAFLAKNPGAMRDILAMKGVGPVGGEFPLAGRTDVSQTPPQAPPQPPPAPQTGGQPWAEYTEAGAARSAEATGAQAKGGGGWTDAALLAMAASLPALIGVVGKRNAPPSPHSVGGGKPRFEMPKMYDDKDKYRSLMASYLK